MLIKVVEVVMICIDINISMTGNKNGTNDVRLWVWEVHELGGEFRTSVLPRFRGLRGDESNGQLAAKVSEVLAGLLVHK